MTKTYTQQPDGTLVAKETLGKDQYGADTFQQWTIPPLQLKAHIDGMAKTGEAFSDIPAGTKTAALDAYAQKKAQYDLDVKNGILRQ